MELETGDAGEPLELQVEPAAHTPGPTATSPPPSSPGPGRRHSSLPPVLDPRAARSSSVPGSLRPPPRPRDEQPAAAVARLPGRDTSPGTPASPLAPSGARPRPAEASRETLPPLPIKKKLALGATVVAPALALFSVFEVLRFVTAPLGRAMRGDSLVASAVLTVVALVLAAWLGLESLSRRSRGLTVAALGCVALGIVMIIVTFGASETAETGLAPAAASLVPFVAPLVPLGLLLSAVRRAREHWGMRYDRREAVMFALLGSLLLFAALELSPAGAYRHAPPPVASPPAAHAGP
jgi:hypothetical protein